MTLDEAIKYAEEVAEENQRVVDTGIVFDDVTIDMLYCDDTEVIEEHLANYQRRAKEHRQLANWLKELKQLKEQEHCEDCINRQALIERIDNAEENFKVDNMDSISIGEEDPFIDGVLSGVFNIRLMVAQAPSVTCTLASRIKEIKGKE